MTDTRIWRVALLASFLAAIWTGYTLIWLVLCALLVRRAVKEHERAEGWRIRAYQTADDFRAHSLKAEWAADNLARAAPAIDRVGRVNEKLRDRCLALEKQNTDLQAQLRTRDRIIRTARG